MNLLSGKHSHTALCAAEDLEQDWYQTFERSLLKMINSPGGRLRPIPFTNKVTEVIKSHRPGEQEDAHEYLVNLLEKLHQFAMDAYMKIHDLDKEWLKKNRHLELTSSVNQIFAGLIRSQVPMAAPEMQCVCGAAAGRPDGSQAWQPCVLIDACALRCYAKHAGAHQTRSIPSRTCH